MIERVKHEASDWLKEAAEQAREQAGLAADATQKAAASSAAKASVVLKARARVTARHAQRAAAEGAERAVVTLKDPVSQAKAKRAVVHAGKGVKSAIDKLNPSLLASVVIKATALQEQANASLRVSGSLYRISGISIGAALPPSVTFQIARLADLDPASARALEPDLATAPAAEIAGEMPPVVTPEAIV